MRAEYRRARAVVDALPLPDPWDVREFCTTVAELRQRPIHLIAWPENKSPATATVLRFSDADYVFYRADLSSMLRDHAVVHELAHLLLGHADLPVNATLTRLSDTLLTHVTLRRDCSYGEQRERDAEAVADLIMQRVARRTPSSTPDSSSHKIVRGFGDALR